MLELIEIGFFSSFFFLRVPPEPLLTFADWALAAIGFLIQYQVMRKCKRTIRRWIFPGLLLIGVVMGEYGMWKAKGWDRLGVTILYWPVACLALGALAGWIVARGQGKRQDQDMRRKDHV